MEPPLLRLRNVTDVLLLTNCYYHFVYIIALLLCFWCQATKCRSLFFYARTKATYRFWARQRKKSLLPVVLSPHG
ncbi:hypothetical protein P4479_11010, partial [Brevibacillus agri]|uniref:hypothetical protein n=1 Tax=Brevibacillus agri TaxID=51101 RepID=UPI002E1FD9D2|nr:hypothetical protein [Brevibacillus agri]